jgi:hypothetical protein
LLFITASGFLQGVEIIHGCPIIYSCGSVVDDYKVDQAFRNDLGVMYHIGVGPEKKIQWYAYFDRI